MSTDLGLPRDAWGTHPNFPHQVLLLASHENFRTVSARLVERARKGDEHRGILTVFGWWKSAMGGHEHYEEHKLYPYLTHRWGLDTAPMAEGHDRLRDADRAVRAAEHGPEGALEEALRAHDTVLRIHLELEESLVIPALLALRPDEFEEYVSHDLRWLLGRHASRGG